MQFEEMIDLVDYSDLFFPFPFLNFLFLPFFTFIFSVFFLLSTHWMIELELQTEYVEDRVGSWRVCRSAL